MQLDLNAVALRLGMAILERMSAELRVQQLETELEALRSEADDQDSEGEGRQGT